MSLDYVTAGPWGPGTGTPHPPNKVDDNFYTLKLLIDGLLAGAPQPNAIANITSSGGALTITTTGGGTFGPFPIPATAMNWRGNWAATTVYQKFDIVEVSGSGIFLVLENHTSGATFDAALQVGGFPALKWVFKQQTPAPTKNVTTASYEPPPAEESYCFYITHVGATAITLPDTMQDKAELYFVLEVSGTTTFSAPGGTTIMQPTGFQTSMNVIGGMCVAKYKASANRWNLEGRLVPVV
jgi:hypothetical protein